MQGPTGLLQTELAPQLLARTNSPPLPRQSPRCSRGSTWDVELGRHLIPKRGLSIAGAPRYHRGTGR